MSDDFELRLAAVAQPGDTMIFEIVQPVSLSSEMAARIKADLAERLPDIKAVLLAGGLHVAAVVRRGEL